MTFYLDKYRLVLGKAKSVNNNGKMLSLMSILIGVMLIFQVNADVHLNWFSTKGYANLVLTYQKTTNAPFFVKDFLKLSRDYASLLAPIQFAFETLAAICLFCGFFRLPMYWLTTGLLGLLMFIEFGVPAAWPPTPHGQVNWLWELLLPTSILLLGSVYESVAYLSGKMTWRSFFLGEQRYQSVSGTVKLEWVVLLSVLGLILLLFNAQQNVLNHTLIYTVLMAFVLMIILLVFDPWRAAEPQ